MAGENEVLILIKAIDQSRSAISSAGAGVQKLTAIQRLSRIEYGMWRDEYLKGMRPMIDKIREFGLEWGIAAGIVVAAGRACHVAWDGCAALRAALEDGGAPAVSSLTEALAALGLSGFWIGR